MNYLILTIIYINLINLTHAKDLYCKGGNGMTLRFDRTNPHKADIKFEFKKSKKSNIYELKPGECTYYNQIIHPGLESSVKGSNLVVSKKSILNIKDEPTSTIDEALKKIELGIGKNKNFIIKVVENENQLVFDYKE